MDHVRLTCVTVDCLGLLVGACALGRRGGARPSPGRELFAIAGFGTVLMLCAAVGMLVIARDNFAVVRVACHVLFCVLAPLLCWRGIVLSRGGVGAVGRGLGVLATLAGVAAEGAYVYARRVEPYRLQVAHERVVSARLAGLPEPLRIVAVADVQTEAIGAYEETVAARIDAEAADLLLFLGDYVQRKKGEAAEYDAELRRFRTWVEGFHHRPRLGIYAVDGDCEWATDLLEGVAVSLRDRAVPLPTAVPIQLLGLSLPVSHRPLRADLAQAVAGFDGFSIVIGHAPDFMLAALDGRQDFDALMLAGHCHGGQVVVPGFGPIVKLSAVPRALARGELWHRGRTWLRVSRGIGMERGNAPPIRLFCPPEIVVVELAGR